MATTRPLNESHTAWVTTFYAGPALGRCYSFSVIQNGRQVRRTVSEPELFELLATKDAEYIGEDDSVRPCFDTN